MKGRSNDYQPEHHLSRHLYRCRPTTTVAAALAVVAQPLAVTRAQAGELLGGKSEDWIDRYVIPHVATVRVSRSVLIPLDELRRWIAENSSKAL